MFDILEKSKSINFVSLQDVNDVDVEQGLSELDWEGLKPLLMRHEHRASKEGPCFIPANFKDKSEWTLSENEKTPSFRHDGNVESISVAVLDLDVPGAREKAEEVFKDFEYIIYSTHSYTSEKPYKFRIALKIDEPISIEDWPELFKSLVSPLSADKSCGNFSRVFYFPSHSPDAKIRPYSRHNEGRELTIQDMKDIRSNYEKTLSPEELAEYQKQINLGTSDDLGKMHFSGQYIPLHELNNKKIDYSYEGMKKEFSKQIPLLSDEDNRHMFALQVAGSAISKFGARTDIFQVIQFLYKASTEYGSKPLTDRTGDTRKEIPEMFHSAIRKFAPDLINGENPHFKDVRNYVKEVVNKVEQIAITDSWSFQTKVRNFSPMDVARRKAANVSHKNIDNSLEGWRKRHLPSMKKYVRSGDIVQLAKDVAETEYEKHDKKTNLAVLGQFIFYCARGYSVQVEKSESINASLAESYDKVAKSISDIVPDEFKEDRTDTILGGSLKVAKISSVKNDWRFGPSVQPEEDSSMNP